MSGFGRTTQRVHYTFTPDEGRDHTWTGILFNLDLRGLQGLLTALLTSQGEQRLQCVNHSERLAGQPQGCMFPGGCASQFLSKEVRVLAELAHKGCFVPC